MPRPRSYDEALPMVLAAVSPTATSQCAVREALGRVLADDLVVPRDMPDLPRSAVDGFAVQAGPTREFKVVMEVRAGVLPIAPLAAGEAAAIMTGAVIPTGADCVVMIEDCLLDGDQLRTPNNLEPGSLINPIGDEIKAGEIFATAGTRIGAALHPALFCAGLQTVPVHDQPRVGLLISGDEVREVEDGPAPGQVFNTNRYLIEAICSQLGAPVVATSAVVDDEIETLRVLAEMDSQCDVIVTSGGVSKGRYDHLGTILRGEHFELLLEGTAIKPGRPLHLARSRSGTLVFGLPGYPSALLTNAFLYLVPALKKAGGRRDYLTRWFPVTLADPQRGRPDRTYFNRVILDNKSGQWLARDPGSQMSSHFLNFARCSGLVRMPSQASAPDGAEAFTLEAGSEVLALDFGWELS